MNLENYMTALFKLFLDFDQIALFILYQLYVHFDMKPILLIQYY